MVKNSTRPLLVGIVERWRALEQVAYRSLQQRPEDSQALGDWSIAQRELTQAETLLWLADQQWAREERVIQEKVSALAWEATNRNIAQLSAQTPSKPVAGK
jgi:hypothetical protein